jgi:hypothetical protein
VWQNDFDDGRTDVDDKPRPGLPSTSTTDDSVRRTGVRSRQDRNVKLTDMIRELYRVIPSVLDPRKCEYLKDYSLDFE